MVLGLRLTGWGLTLVGLFLMVIIGELNFKGGWTMAGMFVFLGGMACTSASGLVATLRYRKKLRDSIAEKAAQASQPAPPAKSE